jgi:hypothetical protein
MSPDRPSCGADIANGKAGHAQPRFAGASETVSKGFRQAIFLPLLCEVEERDGERRRVFIENTPLLDPLPTRSSWGEEEE